jgi:hypothetical protein
MTSYPETKQKLRAPFPWFGGKSRVAAEAWRALDPAVVNYIEPFFGSGAMLLGRPGGAGKIETVNDLDGGVVNFYRAISSAPDEVAAWCDWPVSELDLHARHTWLVERLAELADQLRAEPEFYCAKTAGWWVWGICQWIGTGWCGGIKHGEPRPNLNSGQGVHARVARGTRDLPHQRPHVSGDNAGMGVLSEKLPNLSGYDAGIRSGLSQKLPSLRVDSGAAGNGVHASGLPAIGNDRGINGVAAPPCTEWFRALQQRLRRVRIVCGDWTRVLGNSVLGKGRNVGGRRPCAVFLDPGYDVNMRAKRIYGHDADGLSAKVREWCLEHGGDPDLRIIICGYREEHAELLEHGWKAHGWKGARGYAGEDNDNRENETLFLSPHCLPIEQQRSLFEATV